MPLFLAFIFLPSLWDFCIFHFLLCFLYFLFFLSISLFYFYFYLLFIIFAIVPLPFSLFTTIAFYNACCDKIFPFLPLNHFWLIVGILPRLLIGLLAIQTPPLHYVGCTMPHSQTKVVLFCLLSLLILSSE